MVTPSPLISIVTPVRNGARTLRRCARSVLTAASADIEWIIIDDASTDDTEQILYELTTNDHRVICLHSPTPIGAAASRLRGLQLCRGRYTTFVDADDMLTSDALSIYRDAIRHNAADIYVAGSRLRFNRLLSVRFFDASARTDIFPATDQAGNPSGLRTISGMQALESLLTGDGLTPNLWDKLYTTSLLREAGRDLPSLTVGEDLLLNMRCMLRARNVAAIPHTTYIWRYNGLGYKYYVQQWAEYKAAIDVMSHEIEALPPMYEPKRPTLLSLLAHNYMKCATQSVVQRTLHSEPQTQILAFIEQMLTHPILRHIDYYENFSVIEKDAQAFLAMSQAHLRRHRRSYTFTHLLSKSLHH